MSLVNKKEVTINLTRCAKISGYFKSLIEVDKKKEGDIINVSFPDSIQRKSVLSFLAILQTHQPFLSLLLFDLQLKEVFHLADFFDTPCIFKELATHYGSDFRLSPDYLALLLKTFGPTYPLTQDFLQHLSLVFVTTPAKILSTLGPDYSALHKLKNHLRESLRASSHHDRIRKQSTCPICNGAIIYRQCQPHIIKDAAQTPCCGTPLHETCTQVFTSKLTRPVCTTDLWFGNPDTFLEKHTTYVKRKFVRQANQIPDGFRLPKLISEYAGY